MAPQRIVFITAEVEWFLARCGGTDYHQQLTEDIYRALDGNGECDGVALLTAGTFALQVLPPMCTGGPERILVWHGPTDGIFFKADLLEKVVARAKEASFALT